MYTTQRNTTKQNTTKRNTRQRNAALHIATQRNNTQPAGGPAATICSDGCTETVAATATLCPAGA